MPALLTPEQVGEVFIKHVPGVKNFLFRQKPGIYSLNFLQSAYQDGLRNFRNTPIHEHLIRLLRLIVHYGKDDKPDASMYLSDVAEAFTDCQAVQARTIERVGLRIRGVSADFRGMVTSMIGEYKGLAVKMLAYERVVQLNLREDAVPTHSENLLIFDIGDVLGLDMVDIRRAKLDNLAFERYENLTSEEVPTVAERCRELFDLPALMQALQAELNSFSADSPSESMARQFLEWAQEHMNNPHVVMDEETCSSVQVSQPLVLAILEMLYLGRHYAETQETHGGMQISRLLPSKDPLTHLSLEASPRTSPTIPGLRSLVLPVLVICRPLWCLGGALLAAFIRVSNTAKHGVAKLFRRVST